MTDIVINLTEDDTRQLYYLADRWHLSIKKTLIKMIKGYYNHMLNKEKGGKG